MFNFKIGRIVNRRSGLATNSSSTHSIIYRNKDEVFADLNIFDERYYGRCLPTIAASREAKIRYILSNCYYVDDLVNLLAERYPEIKQYYPMVKEYYDHIDDYENDEYCFGDHARGSLFNKDEMYVSYKALCNVIDNPELVIVGGSDEADFVYETCEGHDKNDLSGFGYLHNITEKHKNGNYYVLYGKSFSRHDKMRVIVEEGRLCPEVPELVDMKITDACEHGCPFCYMNSTKNGKHATIEDIRKIVRGFSKKTEFAIGGGNVLLHPQFPQIVEFIKTCGGKNHIANITIRYDDIHRINDKKVLEDAIIKYVDGIGISVQNADNLKLVFPFAEKMVKEHGKHVSLHLIPELLGYKDTYDILSMMASFNGQMNMERNSYDHHISIKALFLGLKKTGRASDAKGVTFTNKQIEELIQVSGWEHCVDTSFINTYDKFYNDWYHGDEEYFLTRNEGEFSMFIDAVKMTGHKSSYDSSEGFPIVFKENDYWGTDVIKNVFSQVRESCGFEVYKAPKRYFE